MHVGKRKGSQRRQMREEVEGEWQRCRERRSQKEAARGSVGRSPAPPPSMNRRYVPKSVLTVTSWLLNNETAVGATQNSVYVGVCVSASVCLVFAYICACRAYVCEYVPFRGNSPEFCVCMRTSPLLFA